MSGAYYRRTGGAPNTSAIEQALRTAEARAKFDGVERPVYVRVGGDNGSIYIDLADPDWRAVKIDGAGWNVVKNPTVRFVRTKGMLPLALPTRGGSVGKLRDFINVKSDEAFQSYHCLASCHAARTRAVPSTDGHRGAGLGEKYAH